MSDLNLEIGLAIAQSAALPDLLVRCGQVLEHYLETLSVGVWLLNPQTNTLTLQHPWGDLPPPEAFPPSVPLGVSIVGLVGLNQQPYTTTEVGQDICLSAVKPWLAERQVQAFGAYPLVVAQAAIGVVTLFHRQAPEPDLLDSFGRSLPGIAAAIDRLELQRELHSRREGILLRLASHIRTSLDLDTILRVTVEDIREMLEIDRCNFLWCWNHTDPSNNEIQIILAITHESKRDDMDTLLGECSATQTAALRDTMLKLKNWVVEDSNADENLEAGLRKVLEDWGVQSLLVVPMETRSGQLGAIICHERRARPWSGVEIEVLQSVTDHVAIAMEQADLYAQTRATALAAQTQAQQLQEALKNLQQTQSQLVQSEKMSSLGQLVAGVAHEINNPVNFIAGNVQYAQEYVGDLMQLVELYETHYPNPAAEIEEYIEDIDLGFLKEDCTKMFKSMKMGTERIRNIVLSLRNFSRLDEAEVKPVDIRDGIESTLVILENRTKAHGVHAAIELTRHYADLPRVECLAGQLNQVFMNIISNAIDAIREHTEAQGYQEGGQITITTDSFRRNEHSAEPDWVRIQIRDNAGGMPESVRNRIFDPFFTTKPVGQGTGLGLSISYQIVTDKHHGVLKCESEEGKGTEFTIEIPIHLKLN
ncbi:MAG: ATP-binding protein [Prochlorothrix sp.]|nr:ATP-binding protein [Prochlorothrix sp.]